MSVPKMTMEIREKIQEMQNISGQRFGRLKTEVQSEIERKHNTSRSNEDSFPRKENLDFWSD